MNRLTRHLAFEKRWESEFQGTSARRKVGIRNVARNGACGCLRWRGWGELRVGFARPLGTYSTTARPSRVGFALRVGIARPFRCLAVELSVGSGFSSRIDLPNIVTAMQVPG